PGMNLLKAAGGLAAAALMLMPPAASADDAYYKGKTIRFVVGFGVGGGYDAYARMLAPEFSKRLGATVLVENQPGAGGLSSLNRFARAPGDGLQMTLVNGTSAAISQLIGDKALRFDLTELKELGITDYSPWLILVQPKSPHKTLQDLMNRKEPIQFGASGRHDSLGVGALFACHTIKLNCKVVAGYKGSAQVSLALAQGEMDALYVSHTSAYNYVKAGSAKPIVTWNRERSDLLPDVPAVTEVLKLTDE